MTGDFHRDEEAWRATVAHAMAQKRNARGYTGHALLARYHRKGWCARAVQRVLRVFRRVHD